MIRGEMERKRGPINEGELGQIVTSEGRACMAPTFPREKEEQEEAKGAQRGMRKGCLTKSKPPYSMSGLASRQTQTLCRFSF